MLPINVLRKFKTWNVLPLNTVFEQIILTLKYFDSNHGVRRLHNYGSRTASNNPLIMPKIINKFQERTWNYIMPRLWNKLSAKVKKHPNARKGKRKHQTLVFKSNEQTNNTES